jgi:hypothetical protein
MASILGRSSDRIAFSLSPVQQASVLDGILHCNRAPTADLVRSSKASNCFVHPCRCVAIIDVPLPLLFVRQRNQSGRSLL